MKSLNALQAKIRKRIEADSPKSSANQTFQTELYLKNVVPKTLTVVGSFNNLGKENIEH